MAAAPPRAVPLPARAERLASVPLRSVHGQSSDPDSDPRGWRVALGRALAERCPAVTDRIVRRVSDALGPVGETGADDRRAAAELATTTIVRWLTEGRAAAAEERARLASLGQQVVDGLIPVEVLTKMNLWWRDEVCAMLAVEAAELQMPPADLAGVLDVVHASADASLVWMSRHVDGELQAARLQLHYLAMRDPLTGLANRTVCMEELTRAVARVGSGRPGLDGLGVVFLDVDRFKEVNDEHGHAAGDLLLGAVADRLRVAVRPSDVVARVGGDEFVVVAEGLAGRRAAFALGRRLRTAVERPIQVDGRPVSVTVSVGVALVDQPATDPDEALRLADDAMYRVKRAGRAGVHVLSAGD